MDEIHICTEGKWKGLMRVFCTEMASTLINIIYSCCKGSCNPDPNGDSEEYTCCTVTASGCVGA